MRYDAIIVGGGAMGTATAYALLQRGLGKVLLLEQHTIGHERAASTDRTKAIRYEYASELLYSRMVGRSIDLWRGLEEKAGGDLYVNCGVVCWGRGEDSFASRSFKALQEIDIPIRELEPDELQSLYPQFNGSVIDYATYNPAGGFLRALSCVEAFAAEVRRSGGTICENSVVCGLEQHGDGVQVRLGNGEKLEADRVVITAGAWGASLLPALGLHVPLTANKQQVIYIGGLTKEFEPGSFPVFLNLDHEFYGFPLDSEGLLKASIHLPGPVIDPNIPMQPDPEFTSGLVDLLRRYIPGAARGPVVLERTCMYAMTPDEDFILDRFPGSERVSVAAGFSGHGFKFAPLIGQLMASVSLGEEPEFPLQQFALSRFEN